jgi:tRNA threonylcarbamoyladenosine biosynthesis protein TsaE
MYWVTSSSQETQNIGGLIAGLAQKGDVITLSGDLGMGKTTFARGFIQSLVPNVGNVTSPSFALMNLYEATLADGTTCPLWHVDLYRMESPEDLRNIGLEDAWDNAVVLIEWADIAQNILPQNRLHVEIRATEAMDTREIIANGSAQWMAKFGE